jgi:hypothetical protein
MSLLLIAVIFGISAFAWVYNKLSNSTGGNTEAAVKAAAAVAIVVFIVIYSLGWLVQL